MTPTERLEMYIAASLILVAAGAILRFAVNTHVSGVDLNEVGTIVLIVGIVGFIVAVVSELYIRQSHTRRTVTQADGEVIHDEVQRQY